MSEDKKTASARIIKEEVLERESCREAINNLGEPNDRPVEIYQNRASNTKQLRKERPSHSISKAAHERGLDSDVKSAND